MSKVIVRVKEALENDELSLFKFLPGRAFIAAFSAMNSLQRISEDEKKLFYFKFGRGVLESTVWHEG